MFTNNHELVRLIGFYCPFLRSRKDEFSELDICPIIEYLWLQKSLRTSTLKMIA